MDQSRWDRKGTERLREIEADPEKFIVRDCPVKGLSVRADLLRLLGPLEGRDVLELGCGRGELAVFLARQSAHVSAVDVGEDLVSAAAHLARVNGVHCDFQQASIVDLPLPAERFDLVVGLSVLHHLSPSDVERAVREVHRVLRPTGAAVFREPVENSRVFDLLQNLVPRGRKGSRDYRPSLIQRRAWRDWRAGVDDRTMTYGELRSVGARYFCSVDLCPQGLFCRLERVIGRRHRNRLDAVDRFLLAWAPFLKRFSQTALVRYREKRSLPHDA